MSNQVKHPVGHPGIVVAEGGDSDRLAVMPSTTVSNWYFPYNPRNQNAFAEGTWQMWVLLAKEILALEEKRLADNRNEESGNE